MSGIRLPDCPELAINQKNENDVTIVWHDVIVNFFLTLSCCSWRRGVVVITTAQLHSIKPERGVSEIRNGEDLRQWSRLEIRPNAFRRSTIPQKQFIIIISYWPMFHVNIITGSRVMTIYPIKGLSRNPEIGNTSVWVLLNIWRQGLWGLGPRMSLIKYYWILQNSRVTAFTVCELLRKNRVFVCVCVAEEGRYLRAIEYQIRHIFWIFSLAKRWVMSFTMSFDISMKRNMVIRYSFYIFNFSKISLYFKQIRKIFSQF